MTVTIIDFYAEWCGPCKEQEPILEDVETELEDATVEKIDVDKNQKQAEEHNITSIPTILILDSDGDVSERFIGVTQKETILEAAKAADL